MKTVFVTGADRGLGLGIAKALLNMGHRVFAGQFMPSWAELAELKAQFPAELTLVRLDVGSIESVKAAADVVARESGSLDMLISNAAIITRDNKNTIRNTLDYSSMQEVYNVNVLGSLRMTEAFLNLMDNGQDKRLCYVSSEAGSIMRSHRKDMMGYCMSKSALNMGVSMLHNCLKSDGYTFRLYHPGWVRSYMHGSKNLLGELEPDEAATPAVDYFLSPNGAYDEEYLVMRDYRGEEWPW